MDRARKCVLSSQRGRELDGGRIVRWRSSSILVLTTDLFLLSVSCPLLDLSDEEESCVQLSRARERERERIDRLLLSLVPRSLSFESVVKRKFFLRVFFPSRRKCEFTPSFFLTSCQLSSTSSAKMALSVRASARPVLAMASAAPKAAKPVAKAPKVRRKKKMRVV